MRLRLGTSWNLRIGFLFALCCIPLVGTLSYRAVNESVRAQARVAHTYRVGEQIQRAGQMQRSRHLLRLPKDKARRDAVRQRRGEIARADRLLRERQKVASLAVARARRAALVGCIPGILLLLVMVVFVERDRRWQIAMERVLQENDALKAANARLKVLAARDALTGLLNRRDFEERLEEEVVRAERYSTPLSLLLLDIDHFKEYNDTFGHPAGDTALQNVASLLSGEARVSDAVARYGGEEFILLLPETSAAGARLIADRVQEALASHVWPEREVTVSVGVSTFTSLTGSGNILIAEADKALYCAKRAGRNRVVHYWGTADWGTAAETWQEEGLSRGQQEKMDIALEDVITAAEPGAGTRHHL